jgi:hypothetical protein
VGSANKDRRKQVRLIKRGRLCDCIAVVLDQESFYNLPDEQVVFSEANKGRLVKLWFSSKNSASVVCDISSKILPIYLFKPISYSQRDQDQ